MEEWLPEISVASASVLEGVALGNSFRVWSSISVMNIKRAIAVVTKIGMATLMLIISDHLSKVLCLILGLH